MEILLVLERQPQALQFSAYGGIENLVANHNLDAADQRLIDDHFGSQPGLEARFQVFDQRLALLVVNRKGTVDRGFPDAFLGGSQRLEETGDFRQAESRSLVGEDVDQIGFAAFLRLADQRLEERTLLRGRQLGIADAGTHLCIRGNGRKQRQPLGPGRQRLVFQRDAENRFSVGARDGNEFGHGLRVPA
jgi:hypothetical protein